MKKISKILSAVILICGISLSACSDMLNVDLDNKVATEDHNLNSANDSLYSVLGILQQVQYLGERYVILGELRADLMDLTTNSDRDLIDIYFNINLDNESNPYLSTREYYSVINNCNYFINRVDTTIWSGGPSEYIMQREYAVVKAIRAWVYWQLALNYGKVPYITQPILTIADMNKDYPVYDINGIADELIKDLTPYEFTEYPYYANSGAAIGGYRPSYSFIPVSFLLGDLYLWKGGEQNLEKAAQHYHNLISTSYTGNYRPDPTRISYELLRRATNWYRDPDVTTSNTISIGGDWINTFRAGNLAGDVYAVISGGSAEEYFNMPNLVRLPMSGQAYQYKVAPSLVAMYNWETAPYIYYDSSTRDTLYRRGDIRGWNSGYAGSYTFQPTATGGRIPYINKYSSNNAYIYRLPTLYLRFAEAVNRLGKPSVALAVLKNGLSESRMENPNIVNLSEVENKPSYLDFSFIPSSTNESFLIGVRSRGGGNAQYDTVHLVFNPEIHLNLQDSINFVETLILEELALETAFEGNRFHDLMRFAKRSGNSAILTDRVRMKNPTAAANLANEDNWFLPSKYNIPNLVEEQQP